MFQYRGPGPLRVHGLFRLTVDSAGADDGAPLPVVVRVAGAVAAYAGSASSSAVVTEMTPPEASRARREIAMGRAPSQGLLPHMRHLSPLTFLSRFTCVKHKIA